MKFFMVSDQYILSHEKNKLRIFVLRNSGLPTLEVCGICHPSHPIATPLEWSLKF